MLWFFCDGPFIFSKKYRYNVPIQIICMILIYSLKINKVPLKTLNLNLTLFLDIFLLLMCAYVCV